MKLHVKVVTKAKQNRVKQEQDVVKVHVTAAPQKGRANEKMRELLAQHFNVPKNGVQIRAGHTTKNKLVEIKK